MNPEHPHQQGTAQNGDIYFQNREAANKYYNAVPAIVEEVMEKVCELTGRPLSPVRLLSALPTRTEVMVIMGSGAEAAEETIDYMNARGAKVGMVKVHLYRPFCVESSSWKRSPPPSRRSRCSTAPRSPAPWASPFTWMSSLRCDEAGRDIKVVGGRYGMGSKEFNPTIHQGDL